MQESLKPHGGFLVRQILGPTITLDGVELGPLDGKTQLAIAAKVIGRSTGERLGVRYRTLTSHHDKDSRATILTWVFDKSDFGNADEMASLAILEEAIESWADETWHRQAATTGSDSAADRSLRDGLARLPRFSAP